MSIFSRGRSQRNPGQARAAAQPAAATIRLEAFLTGEEPIQVSSSNVGPLVTYNPDQQQLLVEFHGGRGETRAYTVDPVSPEEARAMVTAGSVGGWYWDHVRVRGSATGHQKNVRRIR